MENIQTVSTFLCRGQSVLLVDHGELSGHLTSMYGIQGGHINTKEPKKLEVVREVYEETDLRIEEKNLHSFPQNQFTADIQCKSGRKKRYTMTIFFTTNFIGTVKGIEKTMPMWKCVIDLDLYPILPHVKKIIQNELLYNDFSNIYSEGIE